MQKKNLESSVLYVCHILCKFAKQKEMYNNSGGCICSGVLCNVL